MNPEQQRIAIAKSCGWMWTNKCPKHGKQTIKYWLNEHTGEKVFYDSSLPDYPNDLNAMHEAEKTLTDEQLYLYGNILDRVTLPVNKQEMAYIHGPEAGMYPELFRATAAQRAEAFLRTVGRWEE